MFEVLCVVVVVVCFTMWFACFTTPSCCFNVLYMLCVVVLQSVHVRLFCVLFVLCVLLVTVTIDKRHADVNKTIV